MPIFDYQCTKCGDVQERRVPRADATPDCIKCGHPEMIRHFPNKFNFKLKGRWFKTTGGY